ncbi:MAG: hypothetical protein ACRD2C_21180 [Acidimicrobiales bacterium]
MGVKVDDIAKAARDGITTSIGLGVLFYQRAQVHRQQLKRTIEQVVAELGGRRPNGRDSD